MEFSLNVPRNSLNSVTKILVTVKLLKSANQPPPPHARDQNATTVPARHARDRIFKLNPIHALVIYQIP